MLVPSSSRLSFTRDGQTLIAVDSDELILVDARTNRGVCRIPTAGTCSAIGFADQVWLAHGARPMLSRFDLDGRELGAGIALPCAGTLVVAPVGAPAALWVGTTPQVVLEDNQQLVLSAPPSGLAMPLTGRRFVTASGNRVVAPSGLVCELGARTRVLGGAVFLDGTAALVIADRPTGGRELTVVQLSNGRLRSRHTIDHAIDPVSGLRLAQRRGLLAMRVLDTIALLDLRSGSPGGVLPCSADVVDYALDPDGEHLALQDRHHAISLVRLRDVLARAKASVAAHGTDEITDEPAEPAPPRASVSTPERSTSPACAGPAIEVVDRREPHDGPLDRPLDLRALCPRPQVVPVDRDVALHYLDLEIRMVSLWALLAISRAWDSRRIGYGNEGKHPFEHEAAALLGMNRGFASDYVASAAELASAHEAVLASTSGRREANVPLGAIASELELSPLAIDILLVVAAPVLHSEIARLYGILANDPHRPLVDEALVADVLASRANRYEIAAELEPHAPLVRHGVISVSTMRARPFARLEVDSVVLSRLRYERPELGAAVSTRGSDRALEDLATAPGMLRNALAQLATVTLPARIAIRGRAGSGRRTLLAAVVAEGNRALGVLDVALLRGDLALAIREHLQRIHLAGLFPCVVGLEAAGLGERDQRDAIADVLRTHAGPLAVVLPANEIAPLAPGHVAIDIPLLDESARLELWRRALADAGLVVADPAVLAARYRVGAGVTHRAIAAAREALHGDPRDASAEIDRFIRQTRDHRIGAQARRIERLATWESLVLPPDIIDSLRELVSRVRHRRTVFETWGLDRAMATSRGLTALFSGPPGTGKTLCAGVIARELGLDLYQVDVSRLMSKWIGETERNLAAIFDAAEDGQVVLLFDEADSLFGKRTEVKSSNDRYANLETNYLLQRLDAFEGIAILTTNASGAIDPAFKRRLSVRLSFPFPDEETREQLWRAHLPPELPTAGELAIGKLAHKYQLSGGYIRNACLRAAFLAAGDDSVVTQQHLERAVALEYAEHGKLSSGGPLE